MPVISVTLLPGYEAATEERLVQRLALAARSVIAAPAAGTTSFVTHASTYQRDGRVVRAGGAPHPDASALVRDFLGRMQERQLDAARELLAPDFVMQFPGAATMTRLEELLEWARTRYQRVAKRIERVDESWGDGVTTVHCAGTLHGVWLDGSSFEGVRFIDRFEVAGGLIQRQDVWNDLAEVGPRVA
ncbi:MAG TPA: nuclear transport factor 2 family protein [Ramlibacter sp.]|nr:nuclear transport factor 2 family protein [Ramlibacter sp.]